MGLLLLEECKMVESVEIPAKISDNQLKLEVDRNCAALKSGKLLNNKSVITDKMALALQTDGQKMVAHLKRIENEKQITLDGMHGTLVEIFSQAQEHTESKKLQLFVVLFKILRQKIVEMSAGPAKNAIQTVLAQNSVAMPSEMLQLAFQFWQIHSHNLHDQPQIRLEHPRSRRKRRHGERRLIFDAAMFFMVFMITSSLVEFLKEVLGKVDEFLEFKMIVFVLALFIFAFIRQQPFVQKLASLVVSNVTKLKQE
ncbi:hypothetical protein GPALN_010825 [Globodera pallida]|nr:hypothetical protein GPALN_010825 [Globodera pallida]